MFDIELLPNTVPVKQKPRVEPETIRDEQKATLEDWMAAGVISKSKSDWGSKTVLVSKANGDGRLCLGVVYLNKRTITLDHEMPRFEDLCKFIVEAGYCATMDMIWAFAQVPINPAHRHYTAFVTEDGHFECNRMLYGFKNATAYFGKVSEEMFADMHFVFVYVDDVLIKGDTVAELLVHIEEVLRRLVERGAKVRLAKCDFVKKKVIYMGRAITGESVGPDPSYLKIISAFRAPKSREELHSFLGAATTARCVVG
jgi:hypothetical protein